MNQLTYEQATSYLHDTLRFGIRLGLHRMEALVRLLGCPQDQLTCLHIAGTNGKGSVSAYCAAILSAAGYKTGIFTSPYLTRLTERIRVFDGRQDLDCYENDESSGEIPRADFARLMTRVKEAVDQMLSQGLEQPTEFEILTALAMTYFSEQACDYVVLETGLGGRLDSTNIIANPLACLITALGYDHMDRLGKTLPEIAAEKAGIIKSRVPVYLYDPRVLDLLPEEALGAYQVIVERCRQMQAPLNLVRPDQIAVNHYGWDGQDFTDKTVNHNYHTRLLGIFQPLNAMLAIRVCSDLGLADQETIRYGISRAKWPARMEVLRNDPPLIIDGAHNVQSCQALRQTLERLIDSQEIILVTGMLQDKEVAPMLAAVIDRDTGYRIRAVICTRPDNPRALPAASLADQVSARLRQLHNQGAIRYNVTDSVMIADEPAAGLTKALELADHDHLPVCVFGSLYLMGSIRSFWLNRH